LGDPAALKAEQAAQWQSRAKVRLERADLIEKHWGPISARLLIETQLSPGDRLLDVGTGHGEPALTAAQAVGPAGHVTGVDLSLEMLDAARARAAAASVKNVSWLVQDAEELDLPPGSFDVAVARNSLMFLPRPERAMDGVLECLRPGGCLGVAVVGPEESQEQWTMTVDAIVRSLGVAPLPRGKVGEPGVYSLSNADVLRSLLHRAGYADIRIEPRDLIYDFDDPTEVVTWHEINPTITGLFAGRSETDIRAAWQAVMDAAAVRADADGHVRIRSQIIYAIAYRDG
jgi:SAM-dependent methyltransferase